MSVSLRKLSTTLGLGRADQNNGATLLFLWTRFERKVVAALRRYDWRKSYTCLLCFLLMVTVFDRSEGKIPSKSNPPPPPPPPPKNRVPPYRRPGAQADPVRRRSAESAGVPCVYEGHLQTDRNWYGYLANISVRTTGQLSFEFAYPADRCCQNILFYVEDQLPLMGPRMNCWQREYLLRPEDDQILRLTPSFPWAGCQLTRHDGADAFVCKGGRSFSVDSISGRLTTWYIAASNCAILHGLDLLYRLEVYGHVGECSGGQASPGERGPPTATPVAKQPVVKASLTPREAHARQPSDSESLCVFQGSVNTTNTWYGFIRNLSLSSGGGFRFRFSYPYSMMVQNVILYSEEDIASLNWELSCWEKEGIISSQMVYKQILDMSARSVWNGCSAEDSGAAAAAAAAASGSGSGTRKMTCVGRRIFEAPQKVFLALSNCRSVGGLQLHYRLEVFGSRDPCSGAGAVRPAGGPYHRVIVAAHRWVPENLTLSLTGPWARQTLNVVALSLLALGCRGAVVSIT